MNATITQRPTLDTGENVALERWVFLYVAGGIPDDGDVREVDTGTSTTVLAGFPTAKQAMAACREGPLADAIATTQLVELCGAFGNDDVAALRANRPDLPVGLVTYAGDMTNQLHELFA